jgi:hypothetical protein
LIVKVAPAATVTSPETKCGLSAAHQVWFVVISPLCRPAVQSTAGLAWQKACEGSAVNPGHNNAESRKNHEAGHWKKPQVCAFHGESLLCAYFVKN